MFSLFFLHSLSKDFCFHSGGEGECPFGAIGINTIDEITHLLDSSDTSINITVINTANTPLRCNSSFEASIPVKITGFNNSYFEYTLIGSSTNITDLSISNINVNIIKNGNKINFDTLTLTAVSFYSSSMVDILYAKKLTCDIYSMQYFGAVQAQNVVVTHQTKPKVDQVATIQLNSKTSDVSFVNPSSKINMYIKDRDVQLRYDNKLSPFLVIKYLKSAEILNLHAQLYNNDMFVECDEIFDHISFDCIVRGNAILTLGSNTARLFSEKTIQIEGGHIIFKDSDYQANLIFVGNRYSMIEVPDEIHFNDIKISNHTLNIDSPIASLISCESITIEGNSTIQVKDQTRIVGDEMFLIGAASVNSKQISFENFQRIIASTETSVLPSLVSQNLLIDIPISFSNLGPYLKFDRIMSSNITIRLSHTQESDENESCWDVFVNNLIPLVSATNLQVTDPEFIVIKDSMDPWKNPFTLFTQERVVFLQKYQNNALCFKLLANPAHTYRTYIYSNTPIPTAHDLVVSKSNPWYSGSNFNPYTVGIRFIVHESINEDDTVDFSKVSGNGKNISAFFVKSDYAGAEIEPNASVNVDTLKGICNGLTFVDVLANFVSNKSPSIVEVEKFTALGTTDFTHKLFKVISPCIELQDTVFPKFEIQEGDKITFIPSGVDVSVEFNQHGWIITSVHEEINCLIRRNIDLTVKMHEGQSRLNLTIEQGVKSIKTMKVSFTGYGSIIISKDFENYTSIPPIMISSTSDSIYLEVSGSYVPVIFGNLKKVVINSNVEGLVTSFPDNSFFNGRTLEFILPDTSRIKSINMGNLKINEPLEDDECSIISHPAIKFGSLRVGVSRFCELNNIICQNLIVDMTEKVNIRNSIIDQVTVQGDAGAESFPTVYLFNTTIQSSLIDIAKRSVEKLLDETRMIFNSDGSFNLMSISDKLEISDKYIYVSGKSYYITTSISNDALFIKFNEAPRPPTPEPTSSESFTSVPVPTQTETSDEKGGLNVGAVVGGSIGIVITVIIIVVVVLYYRSVPKQELDSEILTVSNDYMLKDGMNV